MTFVAENRRLSLVRFWPHPAAPKVVRSQIQLHETLARGPTNTLVPSYFRHLHSSAHNHHLFLYFFFSRTNLKHPSRDSNMRLKVNCQADMSACDIFLARDFVGQNNPPLNRLISNTPPCPGPVQPAQYYFHCPYASWLPWFQEPFIFI